MSRILLTGASGFVGSRILAVLLERGHRVAVLARRSNAPRLKPWLDRVNVLSGSLEESAIWAPNLKAFAPEAVIHAAWSGLHGAERLAPAQQANATLTLELQRLSAEAGATAFIGLGSQAEFGPLHAAASESATQRPDSEYGRAKRAAWEGLQRQGAELGQRTAWARLFSCYGPGDDPRWVLPSTALQLLKGERPQLGPCTQPWDFLYGDDAALAIVLLLERGAEGDYNLGSGEAPPLRQTLEQLRDLIDPALRLGFGERAAPASPTHLQALTGKLRAATGWAPATPLAQGLAALVQSLRDQE